MVQKKSKEKVVICLSQCDESIVTRVAEAGLKYVCHCRDCQVHHSCCWIGAGAALEKSSHCIQWLMRCAWHTGNSNHYVARRGTKPQESIDYLFDMLLKPGGQENGGQGQRKQSDALMNGWRQGDGNQTQPLLQDYCNFCLVKWIACKGFTFIMTRFAQFLDGYFDILGNSLFDVSPVVG